MSSKVVVLDENAFVCQSLDLLLRHLEEFAVNVLVVLTHSGCGVVPLERDIGKAAGHREIGMRAMSRVHGL